ncbi:MAG: alpha-amylase/4-alpha-glucanotransferase domain-containing protein [Pirellulaceae bacterium]
MTSFNAQLCLVLHNHQPIGNFEHVFEQAYQDSYRPFLDVLEPFDSLSLTLHISGPLMLWLAGKHPDYLSRVKGLIQAGRVELLGGPMYEPILSMLPRRDRVGQITAYSEWIADNIGPNISGMWTPERVWEPQFASDLFQAGMEYTVLDDFHFIAAGLPESSLTGHFVTEDQGCLVRLFPGSEALRYLIPFAPVQTVFEYLRKEAERQPGRLFVFGDDGEKFGSWPDTKRRVYDEGWLRQFFELLVRNNDWLQTSTLGDAIQSRPSAGKIYLPDCSYREMMQWSLPVTQQVQMEEAWRTLGQSAGDWKHIKPLLRGGCWRNFRVKYPEVNEMYARMMNVSDRLAEAQGTIDDDDWCLARDHLYRAQCNCSYWHGSFGGIYLPHLRNAVYEQLILADNLLSHRRHHDASWVEASVRDYNFDGLSEVQLASDRQIVWLAPARGGQIYEWDIRWIPHNLLATMHRQPEAYHRRVLRGASDSSDIEAHAFDRVVFKQAGLDQLLRYDQRPRKSLLDHFFDDETSLDSISNGDAKERGNFADATYETKLRRAADRIQVQMTCSGQVSGMPLTITKAVTLRRDSDELQIVYLLEDLPEKRSHHFGIELNFAGLPSGADDRYFSDATGQRLGHLGTRLDLTQTRGIVLTDGWLGVDVQLSIDRPSGLWAFPIETVSQSEAGYERVHQSVCIIPHWLIKPDADGRWAVTMRLAARYHQSVDPLAPIGPADVFAQQ